MCKLVNKSYMIRIYPNQEQKAMIENNFIATHRGWNYLLGFCKDNYGTIVANGSSIMVKQSVSAFSLGKVYTQLKKQKTPGYDTPIIPESDSRIKSHVTSSLANAYKSFFKGGGYPQFKKKKDNDNAYITDYSTGDKSLNYRIKEGKLFIPKLSYVKFKNSYKKLQGNVTSITIKREGAKYIASIHCKNVPVDDLSKTGKEIGIDPNNKKISLSNGIEKDNLKPDLLLAKRKAELNRSLSRKKKAVERLKKLNTHYRNFIGKFGTKEKTLSTNYPLR